MIVCVWKKQGFLLVVVNLPSRVLDGVTHDLAESHILEEFGRSDDRRSHLQVVDVCGCQAHSSQSVAIELHCRLVDACTMRRLKSLPSWPRSCEVRMESTYSFMQLAPREDRQVKFNFIAI